MSTYHALQTIVRIVNRTICKMFLNMIWRMTLYTAISL